LEAAPATGVSPPYPFPRPALVVTSHTYTSDINYGLLAKALLPKVKLPVIPNAM
jgi:hypothetical protein